MGRGVGADRILRRGSGVYRAVRLLLPESQGHFSASTLNQKEKTLDYLPRVQGHRGELTLVGALLERAPGAVVPGAVVCRERLFVGGVVCAALPGSQGHSLPAPGSKTIYGNLH